MVVFGGNEKKKKANDDDTTMHEGLWTNGAKELAEFFDYSHVEHFGCALPTHIQRGAILDYINARVTRNCPDFFEKYVNSIFFSVSSPD